MRRILVTGGAGFIGSNFVHFWLDAHPQDRVVVLDALTYAGHLQNLAAVQSREMFRFVHGSIADEALVTGVLRAEKIDTVVNFAAESHVDRSIAGPDAFIATNIVGTHALLKAVRKFWVEEAGVPVHRFHHISSDEVFGSLAPEDPLFTETTPYAPNSPYAASKAAADHLVRAYQHTYGLQTTITNCSNNYGPRQFPEKLIPLCIVNLLLGRPVPVYGDGRNVRDWLHVSDHCRGIELAIRHGRVGEVYNLGSGTELENIELISRLGRLVDEALMSTPAYASRFPAAPASRGIPSKTLITCVADRWGHDRRYAMNTSKAQNELGFEPKQSIEQGLRDTVAWYLANDVWWIRIRAHENCQATRAT